MYYLNIFKLANQLKKYKIGITCCDAGSANIIFELLDSLSLTNFEICLEGPAVTICKIKFPNKINLPVNIFIERVNFLIT